MRVGASQRAAFALCHRAVPYAVTQEPTCWSSPAAGLQTVPSPGLLPTFTNEAQVWLAVPRPLLPPLSPRPPSSSPSPLPPVPLPACPALPEPRDRRQRIPSRNSPYFPLRSRSPCLDEAQVCVCVGVWVVCVCVGCGVCVCGGGGGGGTTVMRAPMLTLFGLVALGPSVSQCWHPCTSRSQLQACNHMRQEAAIRCHQ